MASLPETNYAKNGDVRIAYQILGDRPADVVIVPGISSQAELFHELAGYTQTLERSAAFARVITSDDNGEP